MQFVVTLIFSDEERARIATYMQEVHGQEIPRLASDVQIQQYIADAVEAMWINVDAVEQAIEWRQRSV